MQPDRAGHGGLSRSTLRSSAERRYRTTSAARSLLIWCVAAALSLRMHTSLLSLIAPSSLRRQGYPSASRRCGKASALDRSHRAPSGGGSRQRPQRQSPDGLRCSRAAATSPPTPDKRFYRKRTGLHGVSITRSDRRRRAMLSRWHSENVERKIKLRINQVAILVGLTALSVVGCYQKGSLEGSRAEVVKVEGRRFECAWRQPGRLTSTDC